MSVEWHVAERLTMAIRGASQKAMGQSSQVILSLAVKTGRFSSAGDMIFGILWTQYLSSQKPKSEALRLLGSTRIPYGIGADPIEASREGV